MLLFTFLNSLSTSKAFQLHCCNTICILIALYFTFGFDFFFCYCTQVFVPCPVHHLVTKVLWHSSPGFPFISLYLHLSSPGFPFLSLNLYAFCLDFQLYLFICILLHLDFHLYLCKLIIDWIYYLFFVFGLIFLQMSMYLYPNLNFTHP